MGNASGQGRRKMQPKRRTLVRLAPIVVALATGTAPPASADEGGVSFWLPGQYASFAAIAPEPGISLPMQTYYYSGNAGANKALSLDDSLSVGVDTQFFGQFIVPTWTSDVTFLGARPSFSLAFFPGWNKTSADVGLGSQSVSRSDTITGFGDVYPTAQLFWNNGVNNWMAYVTGNIPGGRL